ncbi:hypothetical protein Nepgr_019274 [Nepenthes gracilis]|uniref:Uncharacterized protein n=1 Tax=Nepenthes gracilis TaxID=150966 RepID=A0AAD3ST36_NEPGR|nr:hypothetical protein Nepgr_019274 [Nepenthes gracilis]
MERSEPSLVPEWLRSTGSGTGGGSSSHHFAPSHSDGPLLALPKRNRSSKSINNDEHQSSVLDRSVSFNSRSSSSSNGLTKNDKNYSRSYSSFTRNHRDREKDRLMISDHCDAEYSEPLRSMLSARTEKETLRCSQSMVSRMQGELLQRRVSTDSRSGSHNNNGNGIGGLTVGGSVTGIQKVTLEKDFPSLVSEERPATPEVSRVSSPGLNRTVQGLPIGNSALISGEGWTSALAEVRMGVGSSNIASTSALQPPAAASPWAASTTSGLNMAEALAQVPSRSHTIPQPPVQTQLFEELAVMQSKRLIPITPSIPKSLVLNPSEKLKPKTGLRSTEPVVTSKNGQLVSLQLNSNSLRGGTARTDVPKISTGKLFVLKPGQENGVTPSSKDVTRSTSNVNNRLVSGLSTGVSSVALTSLKSSSNPKPFAVERKAQVQSRTDFFNSVRQKSMNCTSGRVDCGAVVSSSIVEKLDEQKDIPSDLVSPRTMNDSEVKCNGDAHVLSFCQKMNEDEETAFMRSLGWNPNDGDDEGLTEEEISSFCQKVTNSCPDLCNLI